MFSICGERTDHCQPRPPPIREFGVIGCGRGEWLELLAEANVEARGYDLNRIAVEECRARGLTATLADALQTLASLPEGTWEWVCHPGYNDADLRASGTRLLESREEERQLLTSAELRQFLESFWEDHLLLLKQAAEREERRLMGSG